MVATTSKANLCEWIGFLGILIMAYCNPYLNWGIYHPLFSPKPTRVWSLLTSLVESLASCRGFWNVANGFLEAILDMRQGQSATEKTHRNEKMKHVKSLEFLVRISWHLNNFLCDIFQAKHGLPVGCRIWWRETVAPKKAGLWKLVTPGKKTHPMLWYKHATVSTLQMVVALLWWMGTADDMSCKPCLVGTKIPCQVHFSVFPKMASQRNLVLLQHQRL